MHQIRWTQSEAAGRPGRPINDNFGKFEKNIFFYHFNSEKISSPYTFFFFLTYERESVVENWFPNFFIKAFLPLFDNVD
jgi:hypothetical protein